MLADGALTPLTIWGKRSCAAHTNQPCRSCSLWLVAGKLLRWASCELALIPCWGQAKKLQEALAACADNSWAVMVSSLAAKEAKVLVRPLVAPVLLCLDLHRCPQSQMQHVPVQGPIVHLGAAACQGDSQQQSFWQRCMQQLARWSGMAGLQPCG